jgi:RNA polymerase subunit RPABC4/transcription elongation factor Spt4
MNPCQNCGKLNTPETNFCRFCGTKFNVSRQTLVDNDFDYTVPRPYSWKTDEFQIQNEPRKTDQINKPAKSPQAMPQTNFNYAAAPLAYQQPEHLAQPFRCPQCSSQYPPRLEKRVSTAGWITFAALMVFFFPLFWIGLLIKEDIQVCQTCGTKMPVPQR